MIAHALGWTQVLGAAGLGDIGALFPLGDERWRGADSLRPAGAGYSDVRAAGWGSSMPTRC